MHSGYSLEHIKKAYIQKKEWEKQFPINYFFVRFHRLFAIILKLLKAPKISTQPFTGADAKSCAAYLNR
jgi:hypothetical protein